MRVHMEDENTVELMMEQLKAIFRYEEEIIFICIGTDRSTGDAFGPFVGLELKKLKKAGELKNIHVYGCIHEPVHALNLKQTMEHVEKKHPNALKVAVDACLCSLENLKTIFIEQKSLKPGAIHTSLPETGDWRILGNVNVSSYMDHLVLSSTRLSLVMNMADKLVQAILLASEELAKETAEPSIEWN